MSFGKKGPYKGKTIAQAFGGVSTSAIKGRSEPALKQADPDASGKDETYPFVGRQAGTGRKGINQHNGSAGNFVPAPKPKGGKGKSSPRSIQKFFGHPVHPKAINAGFTKTHGGSAPPRKGFSPPVKINPPIDAGFGEKKQAPRKISRSFAG